MPGFSGSTGVTKKYVDDAIAQSTATQYVHASVPSGISPLRVDVYKRAGFVFISIIVRKDTWAEGDTAAIIPDGYRPIIGVYAPCVNYDSTTNNNVVIINPNGDIKIWSKGTQPTGNIYINAVFLAA